ncbi:MAG: hypothetical protein LHV68_02895 [Elusimicrobia bacterium]|nr:hypothetical protein [Candidatus Liberimonas magnetica]
MDRILSIFNFKKVPVAFIASLAVLITLELAVRANPVFWKYCYYFSNVKENDSIRFEAQIKTIPVKGAEKRLLIAGSSQAREGLDIDEINKTLKTINYSAYNLGISGDGHPLEMFMLANKMISRKPSVIIYMPFIASFYGEYDYSKMKYYFSPNILPFFYKYLGLRQLYRLRLYLREDLLGELSVLYKYRDSIKPIFRNMLKHYLKKEIRTGPQKFAYTKNMPETYFTETICNVKAKFKPGEVTELDKEVFEKFAEKVVSNNIKLIVIDGPANPLIKKCYDNSLDALYSGFISEESQKVGFTYIQEKELPKFNEDEFIDFSHLNAKGREKFTSYLGNYLKLNIN